MSHCVVFFVSILCLVTSGNATLSDEDKEELIRAHNFYRAKAKPTPSDMVALVSQGGRREGGVEGRERGERGEGGEREERERERQSLCCHRNGMSSWQL